MYIRASSSWLHATLTVTLIAMTLMASPRDALTAVPDLMSYKGLLRHADGSPLTGPVRLIVTFIDPSLGMPQAVLYSEVHADVPLDDGVFAILIGSGSQATGTFGAHLFDNPEVALSISVNGEQLTPSQPVTSVPFAFRARVADRLNLTCPDGQGVRFGNGQLLCAPPGGGCFSGDRVECYSGPPPTLGQGICSSGIRVCDANGFGACQNEITPLPETCNDTDDDCDGIVDDGDSLPGCTTGFADVDGDGFGDDELGAGCYCGAVVQIAGDCDDDNPDARPNQSVSFDLPRANGSFDYNCDGLETAPSDALFNGCSRGSIIPTCIGGGWSETVPTCGESGNYVTCTGGLGPCSTITLPRLQRCL